MLGSIFPLLVFGFDITGASIMCTMYFHMKMYFFGQALARTYFTKVGIFLRFEYVIMDVGTLYTHTSQVVVFGVGKQTLTAIYNGII